VGFTEYKIGTPLEEFEKSLSALTKGSAAIYRQYFNEFLEWGHSTPTEFYQWVKNLEEAQDPRERRQLTTAYSDFSKAKVAKGANPNTVLNHRKAIHKFLEANELTLRIKKNGQKTRYRGQKIIKMDQVRKLVDLAATNHRLRALIMVLKDTGLGVSEVAKLTCEDFHNSREYKDEDGRRFKAWADPLRREKTGESCHVHMGPDAVAAIEDYIGLRRTGPIFITSKGQPHKDDEGIITHMAGFTEKGAPMNASAITTSMRHHCGVLRSQGYKISAHSFRKLFETSFDLEGSLNVAKKVMGKAIPPSDEPYLQYEDKLTHVYMEVYGKRLSLNMESLQMSRLRKELEETKKGQSNEMRQIQKELEENRKQQKEMMKKLTSLLDDTDKLKET